MNIFLYCFSCLPQMLGCCVFILICFQVSFIPSLILLWTHSFLQCILLIMLLQVSHFFLPFIPFQPARSSLQHSPTQFMSMGHTYKFFGVSISYTILNLPLSILYLPIMLLIPCTFSPHSPHLPSPLITFHVISISVILFLFQLFAQFVFVFVFSRFSC